MASTRLRSDIWVGSCLKRSSVHDTRFEFSTRKPTLQMTWLAPWSTRVCLDTHSGVTQKDSISAIPVLCLNHSRTQSTTTTTSDTKLVGVQVRDGRRVINLDPTPLPLSTVGVRKHPAALVLGRAQPQPHQMAMLHATLGRVIAICSPRVEDMPVAQKLDIAHLQHHVQLRAVAHLLQELRRFLMLR